MAVGANTVAQHAVAASPASPSYTLEPTYTVEIAFTTDPYAAAPAWTDVSSYARVGSTSRGRNSNLTRVEAGSFSVLLDNRDLRFDPLNTGSPYSPNVKPGKKIRISVQYGAGVYVVAVGYITRWPQSWEPPGYTESPIQARDAMSLLALANLPAASYPAELAGARISRVLDAVGFPAADRVIDVGTSTVVAATIAADSGTTALSHIQDVAETDLGVFYIDRNGSAQFAGRRRRIDQPSDYVALATFGDGGGTELQWELVDPDYDVDRIVNDWRITPSGGAALTVTDATSIAAYGRRSSSRSPLTADVNDCQSQGEYLLGFTKDPLLRFDRLVLHPSGFAVSTQKDLLYQWALGLDIGDRIQVKVRPPGGAYTVTQDVNVEGVAHDMKDRDLTTTLLVSAVDPNTANGLGYWILDDTTYSVLGSTTRLAA